MVEFNPHEFEWTEDKNEISNVLFGKKVRLIYSVNVDIDNVYFTSCKHVSFTKNLIWFPETIRSLHTLGKLIENIASDADGKETIILTTCFLLITEFPKNLVTIIKEVDGDIIQYESTIDTLGGNLHTVYYYTHGLDNDTTHSLFKNYNMKIKPIIDKTDHPDTVTDLDKKFIEYIGEPVLKSIIKDRLNLK